MGTSITPTRQPQNLSTDLRRKISFVLICITEYNIATNQDKDRPAAEFTVYTSVGTFMCDLRTKISSVSLFQFISVCLNFIRCHFKVLICLL